jgi:hypothetical protein
MGKLIWILPGVALGGAGAMLAVMGWPLTGFEDAPVAIAVSSIAVGLILFYAVSFGAAALAEAGEIASANRRLIELGQETHVGEPTEPAMLYEALSGTWLGTYALNYVSSLRHSGKDKRYVGPDPAQSFPIAALIEDRLSAGLFCRFAEIFILLALVSLLLGSASIISDGLASVTMLSELEAVLVATSAALAGAAFVWLTQPALLGLCHAQVRRFTLQLRNLFAINTSSDAHRIAEDIEGLRGELGMLLTRIETSLAHDDAAVAKLADSHSAVLARGFQRVVEDLERNVAGALDRSFGVFTQTLDREFGGVERNGQIAAEARDAFRAACDRLERLANGLAEQAQLHAQSAGNTAERVLSGFDNGLDRLSDSVFGQATGELRAASATIRRLYESVDSLCLSVAPVLNRLVDTQDALLAHMPEETQLAQVMSEATAELKQLAKAQRETIDRHVQLASELARASVNLGQGNGPSKVDGFAPLNGTAHAAVQDNLPSEPRARSSAAAHDVIAALKALRSEADESERKMPRIEQEA